jgi:hypothetical protein
MRSIAVIAVLMLAALSSPARAQQTRDYMLSFQPSGTFFLLDYYGTGAQLTLEHRTQLYNASNDVTVAAAVVPAYPLGEAYARADLRILFIGLGATLAYRSVWRSLEFEPDPNGYCLRCDREGRREVDPFFGKSPGTDHWPYAEARASLYLPFNEHVVAVSTVAARYEGRKDRTFDWFYTSVYDRGVFGRWETQLFFKHRDWGGIGPYAQLLYLPRGDKHDSQWALGFNAVTRMGLLRKDDLVFLTFLTRPGDSSYGQHSYYSPIRALLIYRMQLTL